MKKLLLIVLLCFLLLAVLNLKAQNWVNGGNALSANGTLGTTTNFSVLFKTNSSERGRITNTGLWGIGTTTPNSRLHINSPSGQVPLRIQVNGSTKFFVNSVGGVSIGSSTAAPVNGLFVSGNAGIGTSAPENTLHVLKGSAGAITGYFDAPLIVENSTHSYVNILAPDANETGILFGKPANNVDGGIIYNSAGTPKGLQFRTNGNIPWMILTQEGKLGLHTDPGDYSLRIRQTNNVHCLDLLNEITGNDWNFFVDNQPQASLEIWYNNNFRGGFDGVSGAYRSISDERLKTNIKPMGIMLEKIRQLKPSTYQFKNSADNQEYNGFIAQDVIKLFPTMVSHIVNQEQKQDVYTMDYSQFGVLAIKGIQELQPVIKEQKEKIATLEVRLAKLEVALAAVNANKNGSVSNATTNALLEQNQPNPFNKNTTIRYSLPQGSKGQINIHDQTGRIVKTLNANESGLSELNGYDLTAGTYTYTLIINGKVTLSKQMLIIK